MRSMPVAALVPILFVLVVLASDAWVYADATERQQQGNPAPVSIRSLRLDTPQTWFLGCLLLWVVFFLLYLTATGRNPFTDRHR